MSMSITDAKKAYDGDGITTTFTIGSPAWRFFEKEDIKVIVRNKTTGLEEPQVLGSDFTITGTPLDGVYEGGSVVMASPPAIGEELIIWRDPRATQDLSLTDNDRLPAKLVEKALDKTIAIVQSLQEQINQAFKLPDGALEFDTKVPTPIVANSTLIVNETADGLAWGGDLSAASADAQAAAASAAASAATAAATVGIIGGIYNVKSYGAVGNGVTDDSAAVAAAMAAIGAGGTLYFPRGEFLLTNGLLINVANVRLCGDGKGSKVVIPPGKKIECTQSGFLAEHIWIDGQSYAPYNAASVGLYVHGANCTSFIRNVMIRNCWITNLSFYGIVAEFIDGLIIDNVSIDTVAEAGIFLNSVRRFRLGQNEIRDINVNRAFSNAYGVIISELNVGTKTGTITNGSNQITALSPNANDLWPGMIIAHPSLPAETVILDITFPVLTLSNKAIATSVGATLYFCQPPSQDGLVIGNLVKNNPVWEGLDTHSGRNIAFVGNTVIDCFMGIIAGDSGTDYGMAPQNIVISGNTLKGYSAEDKTKTATGSTINITMNTAPTFTVKVGDYIIYGTQVRRIATVTDQTHYILDNTGAAYSGAFSPQPAASLVTVTQKGSSGLGIAVTGDDGSAPGLTQQFADGCVVSGNTVAYFGEERQSLGSACYWRNTRNLVVSGNSIVEPNHYGIIDYYDNYGTTYVGNTCIDPWSMSQAGGAFIHFGAAYHSAFIDGNSSRRGTKVANFVNERFVSCGGGLTFADTQISLGTNFYDGNSDLYFVNIPSGTLLDNVQRYPARYMAAAAPTTGTWKRGDIVFNTVPDNRVTIGWICVSGGTPGTWISWNNTIGAFPAGNESVPGVEIGTDGGLGLFRYDTHKMGFAAHGLRQGFVGEDAWKFGWTAACTYQFTGKNFALNTEGTAGAATVLHNSISTGSAEFSGGGNYDNGGNFKGYGTTHATKAGYGELRSGATVVLQYADTGLKDIKATTVGAASAGAIVDFITVKINGTDRKIAVYALV